MSDIRGEINLEAIGNRWRVRGFGIVERVGMFSPDVCRVIRNVEIPGIAEPRLFELETNWRKLINLTRKIAIFILYSDIIVYFNMDDRYLCENRYIRM